MVATRKKEVLHPHVSLIHFIFATSEFTTWSLFVILYNSLKLVSEAVSPWQQMTKSVFESICVCVRGCLTSTERVEMSMIRL